MSATETLETQGSVDGILDEKKRLMDDQQATDITEVSDAATKGDSGDTQVHQDVAHALKKNPYLMRRVVRHTTNSGCVTLHGEVDSYFAKQMAQESLRSIDGVKAITNRLRVIWS